MNISLISTAKTLTFVSDDHFDKLSVMELHCHYLCTSDFLLQSGIQLQLGVHFHKLNVMVSTKCICKIDLYNLVYSFDFQLDTLISLYFHFCMLNVQSESHPHLEKLDCNAFLQ